IEELAELQGALVDVGLARSAWGEVQDFVWQIRTFGFHLASLEVRQHAAVHRRVLAGEGGGGGGQVPARDEVLETFRSMARIQRQLGPAALSRYVISFTTSKRDVLDVLDLAGQAGADGLELDVV